MALAVALIIPYISGTKKIAFQRRDNQAPTDPNVLGLFGGGIEKGELPLDAAYREIHEETSLRIKRDALRPLYETDLSTPRGVVKVYMFTTAIPDEPFKVYEGTGYECYTKDEFLARDDVSESAVRLLKRI